MKKVAIWFLTAQKFIFGFVILFASIPITYAISNKVFDNIFFIMLTGLTLYILTSIPLAYAVVIGYDGLIRKLKRKKEEIQNQKVTSDKGIHTFYTVKEQESGDQEHEEFTLLEEEKS